MGGRQHGACSGEVYENDFSRTKLKLQIERLEPSEMERGLRSGCECRQRVAIEETCGNKAKNSFLIASRKHSVGS